MLALACPLHGFAQDTSSDKQKWVSDATAAAKAKWQQPAHSTPLTAILRMDVGPDGKISNITVAQSSGDTAYDFSCVNACYAASPVQAPPAPASGKNTELEINFAFRPGGSDQGAPVQQSSQAAAPPGLVASSGTASEDLPGLLKSQRYSDALERLEGAFSQQGPE